MANCVENIRTKYYQNLKMVLKLQSKMSGIFFETQCTLPVFVINNVRELQNSPLIFF